MIFWFLGAIFDLNNFSCNFLDFGCRLTFPQARLSFWQPRLQEYWFLVLGAIFDLNNFSCSFLDFGCRLTFPQARLSFWQPRLQEYWFLVLGAIFDLTFPAVLMIWSQINFPASEVGKCANLAYRNVVFCFWAQYLIWATYFSCRKKWFFVGRTFLWHQHLEDLNQIFGRF